MPKKVTRRDILRVAGLAAAGAITGTDVASAAHQALPTLRQTLPINTGWKFVRRDVPDAEKPGFNDSAWQSVTLPHTYNGIDGEKHGHYYRGPTWYMVPTENSAFAADGGRNRKKVLHLF
jgi:beta-galactosidase